MGYNPEIHHRKSIRLPGYDYSREGLYFITICTHERGCLFGEIVDGQMQLNDSGNVAHKYWLAIPDHYQNTVLHEFVIMPNHVHGIIEIKEGISVGAQYFVPDGDNTGVQNIEPLQPHNKFQKLIPGSIGAIIRGYKIGVTKWFRENDPQHTVWQRNYFEHIIRNEKSHHTIADYIINNPAKWADDKFYRTQ